MKFLYIEDGALTAAQWLRFAALQESGSGTLYGPAVRCKPNVMIWR